MTETFLISLSDVRIYAHHGVMEQERKVGNEFNVDVDVEVPVTESARLDKINGTVSYADIYQVIEKVMQEPSDTLEHVSLRIAQALKKDFPAILSGKIRITKVAPPIPRFSGKASVTYRF